MPKFILRVDDVGQAVNQTKPDVGLEYFRRWWDAGGWAGLPVYLGVVVEPLGLAGSPVAARVFGCPSDPESSYGWLSAHIRPPAEIALHGYRHKDKPLDLEEIYLAEESFPDARCVIPPYNKYNDATFDAMRQTGKTVLFGGFNGEHHNYGEAPRIVDGVLHLSADRTLYQHSYIVAQTAKIKIDHGTSDHPLVITLHHRWDEKFFDGVRRLRDLVADKLTTVEEAWEWARKNSSNYTSPANG